MQKLAQEKKHVCFQKGNVLKRLYSLQTHLRRLVDDWKFPIEFYQHALITTFVMGIKDNVKTEFQKREWQNFWRSRTRKYLDLETNLLELGNNFNTGCIIE